MKKRLLSVLLAAAMVVSMAACGGSDEPANNNATNTEVSTNTEADINTEAQQTASAIDNLIAATEGTVELDLWCSESPAYQAVMAEVVEAFKATYPTVDFNITIGAVSEADAKDRVLEDVEAAADVFVFADDQIAELVKAGALQEVVTTYTYNPAETNVAGTVEATKVDGKMYAYPLTASNGYFLFYNSEYVTAEQAQSWEGLLAAAEACGGKVGMDIANGWYLYSFFAGAGCELSYDGTINTCDWNSETGLAVATAISEICANNSFIAIGDADARAQVVSDPASLVAYVDGTWAASDFESAYANGYAATKLPTFSVNGTATQMGSYAGYKLVGVNAYTDQVGWSMLLAEFITNEASQAKIGVAVSESPANVVAAQAEELQANPALVALSLQSAYSDRQVVGGKFWDPAAALDTNLIEGTADLQKALDDAVAGITQAE